MRMLRSSIALALITAAVAAGSAAAAPKTPVCNLIVDPAGDATGGLLSRGNTPAWDLLSADIATNAKALTTVIRVAKLEKPVGDDPVGSQWRMDFSVGDKKLYTQATTTPFGDKFTFGYTDSTSHGIANAGATGVFDLAKNEIRVSVPLSAVKDQAKVAPGTAFTGLAAQAGDYVNTAGGSPSVSNGADTAEGAKAYAAGMRSCVAVGR